MPTLSSLPAHIQLPMAPIRMYLYVSATTSLLLAMTLFSNFLSPRTPLATLAISRDRNTLQTKAPPMALGVNVKVPLVLTLSIATISAMATCAVSMSMVCGITPSMPTTIRQTLWLSAPAIGCTTTSGRNCGPRRTPLLVTSLPITPASTIPTCAMLTYC